MTAKTLRHLARKVAALPEPAMRLPIARQVLDEYPLAQAVELLNKALAVQRSGSDLLALLDAFVIILAREEITYERLSELYAQAKHDACEEVCMLLATPAEHADLEPMKRQGGLDAEMSEVPLGMRKFLARKHDTRLLARLMHDPSPYVVRNLLNNPRITEWHVVRIATKRPNNPKVLQEIIHSRRWFHRHRVRRALVFNPYTPAHIAIKLIPTLLDQDLKEITAAGSTNAALRTMAEKLLLLRRRERDLG